MKIRINDLARELEVKAKVILDILPEVGVTEKKTHSSSIEEDEAVKVRKHFSAKSGSASRERASATEVKPKIDLSKISKPGDVARLLKQREQEQQSPARPATPVAARPAAPPAAKAQAPVAPPAAEKPAVVTTKPAAPAAERSVVVTPPMVKPAAPAVIAPPPVEKPAAPPAVVVTPPAHPPAATVVPPAAQPKTPAAPPAAAASTQAPPTAPSTRPTPGQPIAQQRRMITPQTGPRPVYTAPPQRVTAPSAPQGRSMQGAAGTRPMQGGPGQRPQGVVRGQPIFQRPRPSGPGGAPGSRPPYQGRPGEQRRGPHPTSTPRPGGYPPRPGMGGVGPGGPPPPAGRPARPGGPTRRPGQPYIPREKEGTMKGFVPPPRLALSNEPLPITRSITIGECTSVKDLAEKLVVRAKDLIVRLLMKGVMATVNQRLEVELAKDPAWQFG